MEGLLISKEPHSAESSYGIDPHKLYTLEDVAKLLSVDKKRLRWWIKKGVICGVKLPDKSWRIRGIEIIALIDRGSRSPRNVSAH